MSGAFRISGATTVAPSPDLDEHALGHLDQAQGHAARPRPGRPGAGRAAVTDRVTPVPPLPPVPGRASLAARVAGARRPAAAGRAAAAGVARAARAGRHPIPPRPPAEPPVPAAAAPGTRTACRRWTRACRARTRPVEPLHRSAGAPAAVPPPVTAPVQPEPQHGRQPDRRPCGRRRFGSRSVLDEGMDMLRPPEGWRAVGILGSVLNAMPESKVPAARPASRRHRRAFTPGSRKWLGPLFIINETATWRVEMGVDARRRLLAPARSAP